MRRRLELLALGAALLASVAFVVSFALGLGRPGDAQTGDAPTAGTRAAPPDAPPAIGRVEVLNASGHAGVARHATDRLRGAGYDVVYFGNAPAGSPDSSVVLDRVGRIEIARGAAARLGITRSRTEPDASLFLDATVILGSDYVAIPRDGPAAPAAESRDDWWSRLRDRFRR